VEVGAKRGHDMQVIDPLRCYMNITSKKPMVHYKERALDDFDAIIPRVGASVTFFGTAVLRQFEMMGVFTLNESVAISRSRDKLRALQILSRRGLGLPITGFAHSTKMTDELIKMVGGAPLVIKLLEGTQGKGVILAETRKAAESVVDAFREMDAYFLVQEFIAEAGGSDIRCFVLGDKVVAAMQRVAKEGEFRSNLHKGAIALPVELTEEERQLAVKAAAAMGLRLAGVDLLRSKRGPLVMEVNSSPGLEGIEAASKTDVAACIYEYLEASMSTTLNETAG
jgi:ribosomal protein S6--L-glutamate ligase